MTNERLNSLGSQILDASICVHREFGPGLLESVYVAGLLKEFEVRNIKTATKVAVPLFYKGFATDKYYEIDLLVEDVIILEVKAVEILHPIFTAQLISYLRLLIRN
jgi:GxxExxY protein